MAAGIADRHRVRAVDDGDLVRGSVHFAPLKAAWLAAMLAATLLGLPLLDGATATLFVVTTAIALLFGHSLGSHRKLIHDSYRCPRWLEYLLVWCGTQVGLCGPLGLMRQHELRDYAQRLPDCHAYLRHGTGFWRDGWWQLFCELRLERPPTVVIEARVADDRFVRFLERTWMLQSAGPALLLFAVGGWGFVCWGACARIVAGVIGHWLIGHFAHNAGPMRYRVRGAAVQGHNVRFASLLTMGESWHNNHHAYPGSARLGLHPGEWDPGWWVLLVLRRIGLVWDLRLPEHIAHRPELQTSDGGLPELAPGHGFAARPLTRGQCLAAGPLPVLEGPAATLPIEVLHFIVGSAGRFRLDRQATRLVLRTSDGELHGLPALCACLCMRGEMLRTIGRLLAPLAELAEATRRTLASG